MNELIVKKVASNCWLQDFLNQHHLASSSASFKITPASYGGLCHLN